MKTALHAVSCSASSSLSRNLSEDSQGVFVLKPMLQWGGKSNRKGHKSSLSVVWMSLIGRRHWSVLVDEKSNPVNSRQKNRDQFSGKVSVREVDSFAWEGGVCHRLEAKIEFGGAEEICYRLVVDGETVFASMARFPIKADRQRVVVFGDFADGADGSADIARMAQGLAPDMVLIPGDIVYKSGLLQEYVLHYQKVFNAEVPAAPVDPSTGVRNTTGVALARSTVVVAAAGNHDVRLPKVIDKVQPSCDEDLFAFFRIFRQPNNGPRLSVSRLRNMIGSKTEGLELLRCIGPDFVRRSNFALYQGDVQWTVLDANKYMDWRDPELQGWLRKTLVRGRKSKWRFVSFHQAGFSGDAKYKTDWRMRVLAPIFEEFGVQVVFSGHCHFYQRHRPIMYRLNQDESGKKRNPRGVVTVDSKFDGENNCRPQGVIYIVSGAGGSLQAPDVRPSNFQQEPFSYKVCDDRNSLTVLDFEADSVTIRQLAADGEEVDRFKIRA
jgi:hypothetical protein